MIEALVQFPFMRNAVMAALLSSLVCGILGPVIVVRRQVILASGIAHGAYGGVGLAWWAGIPPRLGAYGFTVLLACIASPLSRRNEPRMDTLMGILWAAGMAAGLIFTDLTPGYKADLMSYLFGSILTVSALDLAAMAVLAAVSLALVSWKYLQIEAFLYDETFARTRGIPVERYHFISVLLTSLAVVTIIQVVGLILVIALFTIPPYIAERHSRSLGATMLKAALLSAVFCLLGLALSYHYDLTAGAAIILVACAVQVLDMALFHAQS